jgi:hypothetical protein
MILLGAKIHRDTGAQTVGGLELPFGVKPTNPIPVSAWSGPYPDLATAAASIPIGVRYQTMRVSILATDGAEAFEAQWLSDLSDEGLAAVATGGGSGDVTYVTITQANLLALIGSNSMVPGRTYLVTDFQTIYAQAATQKVKSGQVEPLLVTALDGQTLDTRAKSTLYPSDEIVLDITGGMGGNVIAAGSISAGSEAVPGRYNVQYNGTAVGAIYTDNPNIIIFSHHPNQGGIGIAAETNPQSTVSGEQDIDGGNADMQVSVSVSFQNGAPDLINHPDDANLKMKINGVVYSLNEGGIYADPDGNQISAFNFAGNVVVQGFDGTEPDTLTLPDDSAGTPAVQQVPLADVQTKGLITWRMDDRENSAPFDIRAVMASVSNGDGQAAGPAQAQFNLNIPYPIGSLVQSVQGAFNIKLDTTALTGDYSDNLLTLIVSVDDGGPGSPTRSFLIEYDINGDGTQDSNPNAAILTSAPINGVQLRQSDGSDPSTIVVPPALRFKINGTDYRAGTLDDSQPDPILRLLRVSDGTPLDWAAFNGGSGFGSIDTNVLIQLWDTSEPSPYSLPTEDTTAPFIGNDGTLITVSVYGNNTGSEDPIYATTLGYGSTNEQDGSYGYQEYDPALGFFWVTVKSNTDLALPFDIMVNGAKTRVPALLANSEQTVATNIAGNAVVSIYGDSLSGVVGLRVDDSQLLAGYSWQGSTGQPGNGWELVVMDEDGNSTFDDYWMSRPSNNGQLWPVQYLDASKAWSLYLIRKLSGGASISVKVNGAVTTYADDNQAESYADWPNFPESALVATGLANFSVQVWDNAGSEQETFTLPDISAPGEIPSNDVSQPAVPDWTAGVPAVGPTFSDRQIFSDSAQTRLNTIEDPLSVNVCVLDQCAENRVSNGANGIVLGSASSRNVLCAGPADLSAGNAEDNFVDVGSDGLVAGNGFAGNKLFQSPNMTYGQGCINNIEQYATGLTRPDNWSDHNPFGAGSPIDITYSALLAAAGTASLIPGKAYRVTDFITTYVQPVTGISKSAAAMEPLTVVANEDGATLQPNAWSALYPNDLITYRLAGMFEGSTGSIVGRTDDKGNYAAFDHRNVAAAGILSPGAAAAPGTADAFVVFDTDSFFGGAKNYFNSYWVAVLNAAGAPVAQQFVENGQAVSSNGGTAPVTDGPFSVAVQGGIGTLGASWLQVWGSDALQQIQLTPGVSGGAQAHELAFQPGTITAITPPQSVLTHMFPGSVSIQCGAFTSVDDGNGNLIGDILGTVNYNTSGTLISVTNATALGIGSLGGTVSYRTFDDTWADCVTLASGLTGNVFAQPYSDQPAFATFNVRQDMSTNGSVDINITVKDAHGVSVFSTGYQPGSSGGVSQVLTNQISGVLIDNAPYSVWAGGIDTEAFDMWVDGVLYNVPGAIGSAPGTEIVSGVAGSVQICVVDSGADQPTADTLTDTPGSAASAPADIHSEIPDNSAGTSYVAPTYQDMPTFDASSYGNRIEAYWAMSQLMLSGNAVRGYGNRVSGTNNFIGFALGGGGQYLEGGSATNCETADGTNGNFVGDACTGVIFERFSQTNTVAASCANVRLGQEANLNKVGSGCQNIEIKDFAASNAVGNGCDKIVIGKESTSCSVPNNCTDWAIGDGCEQIVAASDGHDYNLIRVGRLSVGVRFSEGSDTNEVGDECSGITFATGSTQNKVGSWCSNAQFMQGAQYNNVEDYSSNVYFRKVSTKNRVGKSCTGISFDFAAVLNEVCDGNQNHSIFGQNNTLGENGSNAQLDGQCYKNSLAGQCSDITLTNTNLSVFGQGCSTMNISNTQNGVFDEQCSNIVILGSQNVSLGKKVSNFQGGFNLGSLTVRDCCANITLADSQFGNVYERCSALSCGAGHSGNSYVGVANTELGVGWTNNELFEVSGQTFGGTSYQNNSFRFIVTSTLVMGDNAQDNKLHYAYGEFGENFSFNSLEYCFGLSAGDGFQENVMSSVFVCAFGAAAQYNRFWNVTQLTVGDGFSHNDFSGVTPGNTGVPNFGNNCVGNVMASWNGTVSYGDGVTSIRPWSTRLSDLVSLRGDSNVTNRSLLFGNIRGVGLNAYVQNDPTSYRALGIAFGEDGFTYVADADNARVIRLDPSSNTFTTFFGEFQVTTLDSSHLSVPAAILIDGDVMYISDQGNLRILRVNSISAAVAGLPGTLPSADVLAGGNGPGAGSNQVPTVSSMSLFNDILYFSAQNLDCVLAVNNASTAIEADNYVIAGTDPAYGGGPGTSLSGVGAIAATNEGLYAASYNTGQVWRFELTGDLVGAVVFGPGTYDSNYDYTKLCVGDELAQLPQAVSAASGEFGVYFLTVYGVMFLPYDAAKPAVLAAMGFWFGDYSQDLSAVYGTAQFDQCVAISLNEDYMLIGGGNPGQPQSDALTKKLPIKASANLGITPAGIAKVNNTLLLRDGDLVSREKPTPWGGGTPRRSFATANAIRLGSEMLFYDGALLDPDDLSQGYSYDPTTNIITMNFDVDVTTHRLQVSYQVAIA